MRDRLERFRRARSIHLSLLSVLVTLPWLGLVVWWQGWAAWLVPLAVYAATRWLLGRLTYPDRLEDVEARLAGLEKREALRRFPTSDDDTDEW